MASVLLSSLYAGVFTDGAGNALSDRQVCVYQRGTTTQVQVYSDAALTLPITQPLITGTAGIPGAVPGYVLSGVSIDLQDVATGDTYPAEPLNATATGSGAVSGELLATNNLADLASPAAARGNLGLGSAAVQPASAFDAAGAASAEQTRAQAAEALLAPLASPAFSGTPTAPTPTVGDSSTKLATTAALQAAVGGAAPAAILAAALGGTAVAVPGASGVPSLDLSQGRVFQIAQTNAVTGVKFINPPASGPISVLLEFARNSNNLAFGTTGGAATVNWTDVTPTFPISESVTEIALSSFDGGSTWRGSGMTFDTLAALFTSRTVVSGVTFNAATPGTIAIGTTDAQIDGTVSVASCAITTSGQVAGTRVTLNLTQDATGYRTASFNGLALPQFSILGPGQATHLEAEYDGVNWWLATPVQAPNVARVAVVGLQNVNVTTPPASLNGYTFLGGELVNLTQQTTGSQNGLWQVPTSASGAWTRPSWAATGMGLLTWDTLCLQDGSHWVLTTTGSVTVDTTTQTWTMISPRLQPDADVNGLLATAFDSRIGFSGAAPTSGLLNWTKVPWGATRLVTNAGIYVATAGSGFTSGQNPFGIYNLAGTLLAQADFSSAWASSGAQFLPFAGGPFVIPGGPGVDLILAWIATASTMPKFGYTAAGAAVTNPGPAAIFPSGFLSGTKTALPTTQVFTGAGTKAAPAWVALS